MNRLQRRYSVSSCVVMLLVSIGMSWLAVRRDRVRKQRAAVKAIRELGGQVEYEEAETRAPSWLREILGDDFFFLKVLNVDLSETQVTDAWLLEHLKLMADLEELHLYNTQVSDAGLEHLKRVTRLRVLRIYSTRATDATLERLNGLTSLRTLVLPT